MKTTIFNIILLCTLGMTSCQVGFNNFNKQKFTGLRGINAVYTENSKDNTVSAKDEVLNANKNSDGEPDSDISSAVNDTPETTMIKQAIEAKDTIIVNIGGKFYRVENPFYDDIYSALIGPLVPVVEDDLPEYYLEVEAASFEERTGQTLIYADQIKKVSYKETRFVSDEPQIVKPVFIEQKEDVKTNLTWKEERKIKVYNLQQNESHQVHKSNYLEQSKKLLIIGSLLTLALVGLGLLPFLVWSILFPLAYLLFFVLLTIAAVKMGKYVQECKRLGVHPSRKAMTIRAVTWFFLILFYFILFLIPPMVAFAFVKGAQKRKYI